MSEEPWYADGLRFACTRCGNCCTGTPGHVRVSLDEVRRLAASLDLDEHRFLDMYTHRLSSGGFTLRERGGGDCTFWDAERGCTVYELRPRQCRTWPFWRGVVATRAHWEAAANDCPGMDRGELHAADEIGATSASDGTSGTIPEPPDH